MTEKSALKYEISKYDKEILEHEKGLTNSEKKLEEVDDVSGDTNKIHKELLQALSKILQNINNNTSPETLLINLLKEMVQKVESIKNDPALLNMIIQKIDQLKGDIREEDIELLNALTKKEEKNNKKLNYILILVIIVIISEVIQWLPSL